MTEKFEVHRAHKMAEWVEREVYEWAEGLVTEHFGVEEITDLTHKQISEVLDQAELINENYGDTLSYGLYEVVRYWENETDEELEY